LVARAAWWGSASGSGVVAPMHCMSLCAPVLLLLLAMVMMMIMPPVIGLRLTGHARR
jgi:hypothetical protein